jgi:hypothetical protein
MDAVWQWFGKGLQFFTSLLFGRGEHEPSVDGRPAFAIVAIVVLKKTVRPHQ